MSSQIHVFCKTNHAMIFGVCKNCIIRRQSMWYQHHNVRPVSGSYSLYKNRSRRTFVFETTPTTICDISSHARRTTSTPPHTVTSRCLDDGPAWVTSRFANNVHFSAPVGYLSGWTRHSAMDARYAQRRCLHSSPPLADIERSKVEQTVKALKDDVKEKTTDDVKKKKKTTRPVPGPEVDAGARDAAATTAVVKKPLGKRIWAEIVHYYHGFRLLFLDVRICCRYVWRLLNGSTLTRRERRQLVRTTADLFRLVPFSVFVIVPFMELLLPVALKLFPSMLPSTFKEKDKEVEKQRKRLKMKLEMAKFLQDTIEDSAVKRKGAKGETVQGFVNFMEKIRSSGEITTNEEILKYAKVFEDEITLDNLNYGQLRALCKLLEIPIVGVSETVLRFQLELKLRQLEADDRMIMKEGVDSLAVWELQEACRARGMRSLGVTESRLKSQLSQWLDLHLDAKIPTSLLLFSRALYLPETLDTASQIKATITELSESAAKEAVVKISEVSGDRVDNTVKLEVIRQEQKIIEAEQQEVLKEMEREKEEEKKKKQLEEERQVQEELIDRAPVMADEPIVVSRPVATPVVESAAEVITDEAKVLSDQEKELISAEDLEEIEEVLESVAEERKTLKKEQEELQELKEDVTQYKEQVEEIREVIQSKGEVYEESKAVRRLSDKVNKMIKEMDSVIDTLSEKKQTLLHDLEEKEDQVKHEENFVDRQESLTKLLEEIDEDKKDVISMNEIIEAMHRLQKIPDEAKIKKITEVLDEDKDGIIGLTEALKVIELLGQENTKLASKQVTHIVDLLRKEQKMRQDRKERKQREKQLSEEGKQLSEEEKLSGESKLSDSRPSEEKQLLEEKQLSGEKQLSEEKQLSDGARQDKRESQ